MVTGASTRKFLLLIDARKGVIEQTYRHFLSIIYYVKEVIVAVNKMDLVDYSEEV
jgi:sulfate adenylyltransferase subunit 1 (EFTu-like GTPase family)